jgi:hypothetical protein
VNVIVPLGASDAGAVAADEDSGAAVGAGGSAELNDGLALLFEHAATTTTTVDAMTAHLVTNDRITHTSSC